MSLTSVELNYLVWRYLQESGFDLAAFALEKYSQCSSYEHNQNLAIIQRIEPGCLVNLVQKGILFTLAESDAVDSKKPSGLSLFHALLKDELQQLQEQEEAKAQSSSLSVEPTRSPTKSTKKFQLKSEVEEDVEMLDDTEDTKVNGSHEVENGDEVEKEFVTQIITPAIKFEESLVSDWHPATKVFAYGREDSTAVIVAINNDTIAESVQLNHPSVLGVKNEINIVSWSPQGNLIVTAGLNGELRAWSPDGKLKNIANTFSEDLDAASSIGVTGVAASSGNSPILSNLIWNSNSQFLLSIDSENQVSLWDGPTLTLIKQIRQPPAETGSAASSIDACWLDETNFALSTTKFSIKIYSIVPALQPSTSFININTANLASSPLTPDIQTVGYLNGHENPISILSFNPETKLLASCSDYDYAIKVWSRGSAQESLDINVNTVKDTSIKLHTTPIIGLFWLDKKSDDSVLLSVSMDGRVNIWNASTGDNIKSAELFRNEASFHFEEESPIDLKDKSRFLIFTASVSPNKQFLAVSDDYGRVTIWDVGSDSYSKNSAKGFVRCLGLYNFKLPEVSENANVGVCDLHWDINSKHVCVSYKGAESIIFNWEI